MYNQTVTYICVEIDVCKKKCEMVYSEKQHQLSRVHFLHFRVFQVCLYVKYVMSIFIFHFLLSLWKITILKCMEVLSMPI